MSDELWGIRLNAECQMELLKKLAENYSSIPFGPTKHLGLRYYYENDWYSYSDAIFLHLMIRHLKPKRIIEIGSGFSSAVMLDTNDLFLDGSIDITFIEPYPKRLNQLIADGGNKGTLLESKLQNVGLDLFDSLESGDVLFIDSSHVSGPGSDVNIILFEILPRLKHGVYIHFHDIFYPFEYPKDWTIGWKGFNFNECYALRAFLSYNESFDIVMFNTFLERRYCRDFFKENMPDCLKNEGGSIWIKKVFLKPYYGGYNFDDTNCFSR